MIFNLEDNMCYETGSKTQLFGKILKTEVTDIIQRVLESMPEC